MGCRRRGRCDNGVTPRRVGSGWPPVVTTRARVEAIVGAGARLVRNEHEARFDILPLLVATDGAVAAFGRDIRRLRPNIVIGGVAGLDERDWPGAELHIGDAIVRLDSLRGRCHMTTVDPDTLHVNPGVLRDIVTRFGGKLALNAEVVRAGSIRIGDPVRLVLKGSIRAPATASAL